MKRFLRLLCLCLGGILLIITLPLLGLRTFAQAQLMLYRTDTLETASLYTMLPDGSFPTHIMDYHNRASRFMGISEDGYWAYFEDSMDGINNLYRYHIQDGRQQQLTFDPDHAHFEGWSPDGEWIIYSLQGSESNRDLYRIHRTGGDAQNMTRSDGWDNFVAFSNDGQWLYYSTRSRGRWELYRIPAVGGEAVYISPFDEHAIFRSWSPDNQWMILEYQYGQDYNRRLYRLRVDGELQPLSPTAQWDIFAGWSPDREWIISLSSSNYQNWTAHRMRPDGSDHQELAPAHHGVYYETFSPNGDYVFFSTGNQALDLYRMRFASDDSTATRITEFTGERATQTWTPDGQWLIYKSFVSGATQLFRVQLDGSRPEPLFKLNGQMEFLRWIPFLDRRFGWWWLVAGVLVLLGFGLWGRRV